MLHSNESTSPSTYFEESINGFRHVKYLEVFGKERTRKYQLAFSP